MKTSACGVCSELMGTLTPQQSDAAQGKAHGAKRVRLVTPRAVLLGLALVPLNAHWMMVAELRWYLILSLNPLFVTPVFCLFWLALLNLLLQRFAPRFAFTGAELLTIYVMLVLSCTVATHDYIINLMATVGWAAWFATGANRWEQIMFPHLPQHLLVWDRSVLHGYFLGNESLYSAERLLPWLAPLAWWAAFILVSFFVMFCLNVLLRKAWLEHVKLSFPIVQLPLAMIAPDAPTRFFKSPMMWAGFSLAAGIDLLNGLHELYPSLPHFQTRARRLEFTEPPLHVLHGQPLALYPFAIGLGFLVPLDVSFSLWFFYVFARAQIVIGYTLGWLGIRDFPFHREQGIGAWVTYGVLLLYGARHHLREVWRVAWRKTVTGCEAERSNALADDDEPLRYRFALLGAVGGLAFLVWFWMKAGMSPVPAAVSVAAYFLLALCITRVRAEAGGQHTVWDLEPKNLFMLFDSNLLGPRNLAGAAVSHWFWRLNRSHAMPAQLEAFKMAQVQNVPTRQLVLPMLLAVLVVIPAAMWACLHIGYRDGSLAKCVGFARWCGVESFNWLESALNNGFRLEPIRWQAVGSAAAFTAFLSFMKMRYTWFPFHPLGYCIGPGSVWTWFPFLLAWASKLVLLRYGGNTAYRKAVPFFLGLILGDYIMGASWSLYGAARGVMAYQIFH
ncbi:MAG: hypothetical protein NZT92_07755 [Abditibacteriales bacterium]|nr:hypothetical protein [Abditibacteriales bacterium]MDW8366096.1 DUF6785 family protein [Abditibacteriales bacterium]